MNFERDEHKNFTTLQIDHDLIWQRSMFTLNPIKIWSNQSITEAMQTKKKREKQITTICLSLSLQICFAFYIKSTSICVRCNWKRENMRVSSFDAIYIAHNSLYNE